VRRDAHQLASALVARNLFPGDARYVSVDLDAQQAAEGEDVAGEEILDRELGLDAEPLADSLADPARVLGRRLDQDVEITRRPVRDQRDDRDPADDDVGRAFFVEHIQEIGKVLCHRRALGTAKAGTRYRAA
jgi:hypothetical protein